MARASRSPGSPLYVLSELQPNTTYTLNLTATNHKGEGPPEATTITTYPNDPGVDDGQGYLLLTSGASLLKLGLDTIDPLQHIYNTSSKHAITGMAVHIRLGIVYISDSSGSILQLHPTTNRFRTVLSSERLHGHPLGLSVDWLYGHLYYIIRLQSPLEQVWQLWRCGLTGDSPEVIHGELQYEAKHLQVDPYNGYIWWISEDLDPGLHRLDLRPGRTTATGGGDEGAGSGGGRGVGGPKVVLESTDLGGLVLDPPNFQVLVANRQKNAMLAVSLDGTSVTRLHPNTQQAFFRKLSSVVYLHRRFFWTDGKEVLTEELNNGTFYHNSYLLVGNVSIGTLAAVHRSTQPVPVPLNPPTLLQAVFTRRSATLTWNAPVLPALMGEGAWQQWRYELHIQDGSRTIYRNNITTTEYLVANLRPATFYVIKVRAYSQGGRGPWSAEFRGSTLDATAEAPRLVLATDTQLLMTNLAGSDSRVVVAQEKLMTELKGGRISDLAFYRDAVVLAVSNQSSVLLNTTTGAFRRLVGTKGVLSLAVDWVAARLFWANPHKQMIGWSQVEGLAHGPFNVVTAAREVRVDALHGRLYWTTSHSLHSSTLAGRNLSTLHREGIFSGKQVYGLTVDAGGGRVWWVVRDVEGCHLYSATLTPPHHHPKLIGTPRLLPHTVQVGSMWYLSERLVWLGEDGDAVVADIHLNNSASLHTASLHVAKFTVVLGALHPAPEGVTPPNVLPGPIEAGGVMVMSGGTWDNFTITWPPITNITHGDLEYEVLVGEAKTPILTTTTSLAYTNASLPPYSPLRVSVRGVTNWGVGPRVVTVLRTPPAMPGAPRDLRTFVVRPVKDITPTICLRWSPPGHPNGALTGYSVAYWQGEDLGAGGVRVVWVPAAPTQFLLHDLDPAVTYTFRVSAINTVGEGPASTPTTTQPQHHRPLPLVVVVRANQSRATTLDADMGVEETLVAGGALGVRFVAPLLPHYINTPTSTLTNAYASALSALPPSSSSSSSSSSVQSSTSDSSVSSSNTSSSSSSSSNSKSYIVPFLSSSSTPTPPSSSSSSSSISLLAWMDINSDIFLTHPTTNVTERVLRLEGEGVGLALDWVGEVVVWGERRPPAHNMSLHSLTLWRKGGGRKMREVVVQGKVLDFVLSPMTSQVFVVHSVGQRLQLSVAGLKGDTALQNVFDQKRSPKCNCRRTPKLTGAVALDSTHTPSLHLYFSTASTTPSTAATVYRTDLEGCVCEAVFDPSVHGLESCTYLAVDSSHLYCHDASTHTLAWLGKGGEGRPHTMHLQDVSAILPLDPASQPLPATSCLVMRNYTHPPKLVGSSETAIGLELRSPQPLAPDCGPVSLPPPTYLLYYSPIPDPGLDLAGEEEEETCKGDIKKCQVKRSADPIITVEDLQPYTHYVFRAAVETVYNQRLGLPSHPGPPTLYRTKAKAPESVGEVTAQALSPEEVQVGFLSVAGRDMSYTGGARVVQTVWVKVFSRDGLMDVDSERVGVMTLPPLPTLTLRHATPRTLLVDWTAPADGSVNRHRFQYLPEEKSLWRSLDTELTSPDHTYHANLTHLIPATHYLFRIQGDPRAPGGDEARGGVYHWGPGLRGGGRRRG
ncbi:Proto-oncogene tyrosine-protein kinase ROS [Chionoecetes opilio]|uniref:Proto-oncogene tyrosine-protein kinase ROS n=1 Tax=Chionoecetes opilio TaxID=41210 RepID=A0A8J5CZ53_CHIOP|nr:Proto-oncogene tyrosine-protein kinase ROS [Chionoecetes opilio]